MSPKPGLVPTTEQVVQMLEEVLDLKLRPLQGFTPVPAIGNNITKAERRHQRRMWRASLHRDSHLTAEEVSEALPGRAVVNRKWLLRHVEPIALPSGMQVYRWGDVLRALGGVR